MNHVIRKVQRNNIHWIAAKRVWRYLQFTKTMQIVYDGNCDLIPQGASDADWSGDASDRKSTTGFYYKLNDSGGAISWNCKKQNTIALSSCEAEYQGMCAAVQGAIFLKQILEDLFISQMKPTQIAEDNQSCIKLCNNPVFNKRSKHMSTKLHYIRESGRWKCGKILSTNRRNGSRYFYQSTGKTEA